MNHDFTPAQKIAILLLTSIDEEEITHILNGYTPEEVELIKSEFPNVKDVPLSVANQIAEELNDNPEELDLSDVDFDSLPDEEPDAAFNSLPEEEPEVPMDLGPENVLEPELNTHADPEFTLDDIYKDPEAAAAELATSASAIMKRPLPPGKSALEPPVFSPSKGIPPIPPRALRGQTLPPLVAKKAPSTSGINVAVPSSRATSVTHLDPSQRLAQPPNRPTYSELGVTGDPIYAGPSTGTYTEPDEWERMAYGV